jgi:hypothetical protein
VIEWDGRIAAAHEPPRARAVVLASGQAQIAVVASGSDAEAADEVVRAVEAVHAGWREAAQPETWCAALVEADRRLARAGAARLASAAIVAVSLGRMAGARAGDCGAWLFTAGGFADLTAACPPGERLGSGRALPSGFGPLPAGGTLVVATAGLFALSAARVESCVAHTSCGEAAALLADLAHSAQPAEDLALAVVRPG